jgi:2-O-methyltransferase
VDVVFHRWLLALRKWSTRRLSVPEPRLTGRRLRKLIGRPDPVILDIGANDGSHSRWFARLFPEARIFAFEPEPRAIARFRKRVDRPNVTLVESAVSASDGEVRFFQSSGQPPRGHRVRGGWDKSGSIRRPTGHLTQSRWCKFRTEITVKSVCLDSWVAANRIERIDFIWADVQGAERDLIAGGGDTFATKVRYFYTEYSDRELYEGQADLAAILAALKSYRLVSLYRHDVLLKPRRSPAASPRSPAGAP